MKIYRKRDFPVSEIRRFIEPGPVVLVSSFYRGETNIMTMGWHMVMEFEPSRIGCFIWEQNHSFGLIRKSRECVINIPTVELIDTVVKVGCSSGAEVDKFAAFGLTPLPAKKVRAPLIRECFANLECRLVDTSWVKKHSIFVFEVVKAHAPASPRYPRTIHYRGDGMFMVAGKTVSRKRLLPADKR